MKKATQDNKFINVSTPYGKDAIILNSFEYREEMSELFSLRVYAYFNGQKGELNKIVGQPVIIKMDNNSQVLLEPRYFHGFVAKATLAGSRVTKFEDGENYKNIELVVVPKLNFANYKINSRIFQNKDIKEIISLILGEHGVDFSFSLTKSYAKYNYKVQYEESDLQFVKRLLSEEGLSFCFSHTKSSHVIEIFDDASYYKPGAEFLIDFNSGTAELGHISSWHEAQSMVIMRSHKSGYDMKKPASHPSNTAKGSESLFTVPSSEHYEYLGEAESGDQYKTRNTHTIESLQQNAYVCSGESSCRSFAVGRSFKFGKHEDPSRIGKEFVLSSIVINAAVFNQVGHGGPSNQGVRTYFTCIESGKVHRPAVNFVRPVIRGIQTAVVTGNKQGEIYVDKYGRIKVQFHWDREGKFDTTSSCWIRVAQQIAGNGWGSSFLPRVGQEVIVEFINGDPDQPVVTGSLYNGTQAPPFSLPEKKTQSGYRSQSVEKGASNFNELRFEDKPGEEHVYLHAEKNFQMVIEDSADVLVENNKTQKITNNLTEEVGQNVSGKIGKNYSLDIGEVLSLTAGKSIEIKVGGASIQMSSSGEINIKGNKIAINGASIALKAGQISLN
ncbi:type VI secretion system tip protein VgrG [Vibrio vulnificus]|uniref:type VI secretion system Vgr family protein n=1 Tax=Vibrio vulnificus TaxID=672 RepID=UPI000C9E9848|nr:type VI secretion system tip protein VgrG [Vibrio vulnificus]PNG66309.1 type IV secretion protein Rhs [Vibrio vulnificus]POC12239.1 type VI secretion system tip protein VgrG [Vibrio vulnificus]POC80200.1 type VI secretion system tip protein VgrG [Vibrio vulnificus]